MYEDQYWQAVMERDSHCEWQVCLCRTFHRHLLQPILPVAATKAGRGSFLPIAVGGGGGRVSRLQALSPA